MRSTFRSLTGYNYRLWASGAFVSNVGTWMQRTAQDWLVLTELTANNATAVGIVMSLQFGPQLLLLPVTGWVADRFDRRRVLMITQGAMGLLALGLGLLAVEGSVRLWHVYGFALALGCVTAFDAPARQAFISEMVSEENLSNAVALNSTSFSAARMIGPAAAGTLISLVGSGVVFLVNAASFVAVLAALFALRVGELHRSGLKRPKRGGLVEGFRYVGKRPDLKAVFAMLFLVATFAFNFPIFISTMAVTTFHLGSAQYGMLTSTMAVGSVAGALMAAQRSSARISMLIGSALALTTAFMIAAGIPNLWVFAAALAVLGGAGQTFNTTANSLVQLSTEAAMRGRVLAILLAIALGTTPLGAPLVGWVADRFGPRWALAIGGTACFLAAMIGARYAKRVRRQLQAIDHTQVVK